jgi:Fe-S cluster biogenesis protein NfuA
MATLPVQSSQPPHSPPSGSAPASSEPLPDRVARILNLIRPAIQSDGGDVELVGVTPEGVVEIRLHGACVGCPSSTVTLQMGIERNLREHVPEVRSVRAVE